VRADTHARFAVCRGCLSGLHRDILTIHYRTVHTEDAT
jgi:hypothetical protein